VNVETVESERTGSFSAVSSIVHDLRNPLATIQGSAEMLVRSNCSQPQVDQIARRCIALRFACANC
jgi:K+-sensing histidine kinase KdpD